MSGKILLIQDIIKEHKRECNFYVHGQCNNVRCMKQNWRSPLTDEEDFYRFVGCVYYQTVQAIKQKMK